MANSTYVSERSHFSLGTYHIGPEHFVTVKRYANGSFYAYFYHGIWPNVELIGHEPVACVKQGIDKLEALVNTKEAI